MADGWMDGWTVRMDGWKDSTALHWTDVRAPCAACRVRSLVVYVVFFIFVVVGTGWNGRGRNDDGMEDSERHSFGRGVGAGWCQVTPGVCRTK